MVNYAKSHLVPSRSAINLGMFLESPPLKAFPSMERVSTLQFQLDEFLSLLGPVSWVGFPLFTFWFRGTSSYEVSSAGAPPSMGFSGRVRGSLLDLRDREGPRVVVRHGPSASGYLPRDPAPRPALLVRRLGSGVGSLHPRPVCLRSVVGCGVFVVHQPPRASGNSSRASPFRPVSTRFDRVFMDNTTALSYVKRQGGDVFCSSQPGGTTPSPLGSLSRPVSGSPIYSGGLECGCRLYEPSSSGPRFGMDPGSGSRQRVGSEVAVNSRSFRHGPQLPSPGVFLSPIPSYGSRHR